MKVYFCSLQKKLRQTNILHFDAYKPSHCTMELVSTEEGTFNFWALEATDPLEN